MRGKNTFFFLPRIPFFEKNLLTHKNYFVPDVSADDNCLIINVIHFVIEGVVQDNFFVVAGQFCHAGTDRRSYNLVIVVVREVESAVVIVVIHILIDYNHGSPSVEERVGDDGSKRRTADYEATVDVAAIDAVVEVVGYAVVIDRSDVVRNMHIAVVVVVIRVYIGGVRYSVSRVRTVTVTIGMPSRSGLVAPGIVIASSVVVSAIARTRNRLRLCLTLCGISAFCFGVGGVGRRGNGIGVGLDSSVAGFCRSIGIHVLSCRCSIRRGTGSRRTGSGGGGLVSRCGIHSAAGRG